MLLSADFVEQVHGEIIARIGGLPGFAGSGRGGLEAALARIENHSFYCDVKDIFDIAALYADAIARGHVFNDGNKRTALTCSLTYLERQAVTVPRCPVLVEAICKLAEGHLDRSDFAWILNGLAEHPEAGYDQPGPAES